MNFFGWLRRGVRDAVAGGVVDGMLQVGSLGAAAAKQNGDELRLLPDYSEPLASEEDEYELFDA